MIMKKYLKAKSRSQTPEEILLNYLKKLVKQDEFYVNCEVHLADKNFSLQGIDFVDFNTETNNSRFEQSYCDSMQSLL